MMVPVIRRPTFIYKNPSGPLYSAWAELELTDTVATGFGGLRMPIGSPNLDLYSILGARYFNDGLSITPRVPVFGFQHSAAANKDWVDPIVGLTGRYRIDDKWFVNAEGTSAGLNNSAAGHTVGLLRVLQTERDAPCHSDQPF